MESLLRHLSASAEVALEGNYYREQSLRWFYEDKDSTIYLKFIVDIQQNTVQFILKGTIDDENASKEHTVNGQVIRSRRDSAFEIKTSELWTYNNWSMAEACVKFLLSWLVNAAYLCDLVKDQCKFAQHLQDEFKDLLGVEVNLY